MVFVRAQYGSAGFVLEIWKSVDCFGQSNIKQAFEGIEYLF